MPYKIEDEGSCFKVVNKETGKVHAKCTTKEKAEAQIKLLRGIDHGKKTESNIDRVLNILVEKDEIITKDLFDQALKVGKMIMKTMNKV